MRDKAPVRNEAAGVAAVLVHYYASAWLARAIGALTADVTANGLAVDVVVVDNGGTAADADVISRLPVRAIAAGGNRGYAGGVNLGIRSTSAPYVVAMNPDVDVIAGCLSRLVRQLERGSAAAGPRFYWDSEREMVLPPTERREPLHHALRRLAVRGGPWLNLARRSWRRHARRHWLATRPLRSRALSGALIAVRRDAWDVVGPFDEAFQLYFEETDWLLRLKRYGFAATYVPGAEAVHHYQRSALREPSAPVWFAESEALFEAKHYGCRFRAVLDRWSRTAAAPTVDGAVVSTAPPEVELPPRPGPGWIEVSPSPLGFPAAASRVGPTCTRWRFPASVWNGLAPGTYSLHVLDVGDRVILRRSFRKTDEDGNGPTR